MMSWLQVALVAALAGLIIVLVLLLVFQRFLGPKTCSGNAIRDVERWPTLQHGIARLHQVSPFDREGCTKTNHDVSLQGVSTKPFFSWTDHPSLIVDAVENGWPRFAFTTFISSLSIKSSRFLSGVFAVSDHGNESNVEISWEVCEGSSDHMQKVRLNPGLKKIVTSLNSSMGAQSVTRTALPLPGPHFGNSAFPQEAYFEITILPDDKEVNDKSEGETIKLIRDDSNRSNNSECFSVTSSHSQKRNKIEEVLKFGGKQDCENETILLSIGLTGGGHLPLKTPGSFPGSIGFNSSGSVYLNGTKLVFESEKEEWGSAENVIGCGYNPGLKKVFFTVNSQLVRDIHCKNEEFGHPLYPTIAANTDITVLVNLGQSPFKFEAANSQRNPNPCFFRPQENAPAIGYEDSKELFSIGRIDSKWLQWAATTSNNNTANSFKSTEFDQRTESDLFEISLR